MTDRRQLCLFLVGVGVHSGALEGEGRGGGGGGERYLRVDDIDDVAHNSIMNALECDCW